MTIEVKNGIGREEGQSEGGLWPSEWEGTKERGKEGPGGKQLYIECHDLQRLSMIRYLKMIQFYPRE
jgi:hypothetical protein